MTRTRQDIETTLAALEPPGPPDGLRDRALGRAGAALGRPTTPDVWARVYASRPLRAAWATAVFVLVVANVFLPRGSRRSGEEDLAAGDAGLSRELRQVASVPRLREAYVSLDELADRRPEVGTPKLPESRRKEKPT